MTLFPRHARFVPPALTRAGTSQRDVPTLNRNNPREEARTPRAERLKESNPTLANAAFTRHTCQRNGEREYQALRRDAGRIARRDAPRTIARRQTRRLQCAKRTSKPGEHFAGLGKSNAVGRSRCLARGTAPRLRTRPGRNQTARTPRLRSRESLPH